MDPAPRTSAALFRSQPSSKSSKRDADESSQPSTPRELSDLEKAETVEDERNATTTGATRTISTGRVSRIQSLRQRQTFAHPLSHVKTSTDVVVDFDGPDDPYRPINWPYRKKVITTVLYGFTTMGSTWASSV